MYGGVTDKQKAQVAKKTIDTLQEIEASRQAYEDSQLVYGFLMVIGKRKKLLVALLILSNNTSFLKSSLFASPAKAEDCGAI